MRKLFLLGLGTFAAMMLGGAAQAADMPVKAPPPPPPPMYNWTGFYIGAHIGGAWADRNGNDRFDGNHCFWGEGSVCFEDSGFGRNDGRFIAGGQLGFNYQVNQWVWGVEGQISALTNNDNDSACGFVTWGGTNHDHLFNCNNRGNWVATVAARLGVTFGQTGNWLLYGTAGMAVTDIKSELTYADTGPAKRTVAFSDSDTKTGWVGGVGGAYAFTPQWSIKAEWLYADFGKFTGNATSADGFVIFGQEGQVKTNMFRAGIDYRF